MKILTTKRYIELVKKAVDLKQATHEIQRKEYHIQKKQNKLNSIEKLISKITSNSKKEELQQTLNKILEIIEN